MPGLPPSLTTRTAAPEDAPTITSLVVEGLDSYRAWASVGWKPPSSEGWSEHIAAELARPEVWGLLAVSDGDPVGHVLLSPRTRQDREPPPPGTLRLWQLFVRPQWQGRGVAVVLLDAAVAEARTRGISRLSLWTPRDHGRARAFYEREGWAATGSESDGRDLGLTTVEYARPIE